MIGRSRFFQRGMAHSCAATCAVKTICPLKWPFWCKTQSYFHYYLFQATYFSIRIYWHTFHTAYQIVAGEYAECYPDAYSSDVAPLINDKTCVMQQRVLCNQHPKKTISGNICLLIARMLGVIALDTLSLFKPHFGLKPLHFPSAEGSQPLLHVKKSEVCGSS